jgi:ribosomal protein S18 acetylase RimI-like enzyme
VTIDVRVLGSDAADAVAPAVLGLLRQLSSSAAALDDVTVAARIRDERLRLVGAFAGPELVGIASLALVVTLSGGLVGRVEDVVVASTARGGGVGRALMQALHDEARRLGVRHLELTSRPSRTAANALYVSLGYERRETNVYRLTF